MGRKWSREIQTQGNAYFSFYFLISLSNFSKVFFSFKVLELLFYKT
jgi:hypothetical protein